MISSYYREVLSKYGYDKGRSFIHQVIDHLEEEWEEDRKKLFVVEAPTGYGKSTITATLAQMVYDDGGKMIAAYPLRALLEDQHLKLQKILNNSYIIGKQYMYRHESPYLIKPITLTTVDSLSLTMFGLAPEDINRIIKNWDEWSGTTTGSAGHYLFSWSTVLLSDLVLDEVHLLTDETRSLNYLAALMNYAAKNEMHLILMSATLPDALRRELRSCLGKFQNRLSWLEYYDPEFDGERLEKTYGLNFEKLKDDKHERILHRLVEGWSSGFTKALVVFNRVRDAMEFYTLCKERIDVDEDHIILLHSLFTNKDREDKSKKLNKLKSSEKYVVVTTQVVEAGVDMSSNLLITELAPANSLVQRFGRFLRYGEKDGMSYIWVDGSLNTDKGRYKVYDKTLCMRTLEYLEKNLEKIKMHIPTGENGYKRMLNYVYDYFEVSSRDVEDMLLTFTNFDSVSDAVKIFMKVEGSFVGRTTLTAVIPQNLGEAIPVDFNRWRKLVEKDMIKEVLTIEGNPITLEELRRIRDVEHFLKYTAKKNVCAFKTGCFYDGELGLLFDMGEGDAEDL
ncbi:CRISPR-associated nuclease/helicase Cas3 [archaeon HR01]|nr:CRISPR-associated nuclease/helicase Cas3 [archaeon HR01]